MNCSRQGQSARECNVICNGIGLVTEGPGVDMLVGQTENSVGCLVDCGQKGFGARDCMLQCSDTTTLAPTTTTTGQS